MREPAVGTYPSPSDLREALCRVPTPVTVVTTMDGASAHGTTVSAFCSLSADPPLVLVALDRASNLLRKLYATRRFGVSVLAEGQEDIARCCARKEDGKFNGIAWHDEQGVPWIDGAANWLSCVVEGMLPGGDHEIVTARVLACAVSEREPLVYHRRRFALPAAAA
jgi:flavin reductase (DIM6/NTAB) family NADH-FMN oxidoreductase RutF